MIARGCTRILMAALAGWVTGTAARAEVVAKGDTPKTISTKTVGYTEQTPPPSAHTNSSAASKRMPAKKWPDVSGVVVDGTLDTSTPNLEAVVRCLMAQQEAVKAGDMTGYHEIERQAESNLFNVVAPSRLIPHAAVSLFACGAPPHSGALQTATADAEGTFEFFDVPRGLYRVVAQDTRNGTNDGLSAELTMEHYRTREHVRLVVYPQTMTLAGRVANSSGRPVTNVTVSAKRGHERYVETEGDFTRAYHETAAVTDSEGRYELKRLAPAGVWEAGGLEGGGYGGADAWYTVTITAPGYVTAKAFVPVVPEEMRQAARTFSGLLKNLASAHAKAGRQKVKPVVQPPCRGNALTGVDFVMYKSTCVEGTFVDKSGLPQQGCTVLFSLTNSVDACSYQAFMENSYRARCDAEGRFGFDSVAPGAYKVQAYEENRLVSGKFPLVVTVREGEPIVGLRLVHDALPCGKIVGVVVDAMSGKPVKGVTVLSVHKETGSTYCPPFLCLCGKSAYHTAECERWIERVLQTNDMRVSTFVVEKAAPGQTELVLKAPDYAEERIFVDVASQDVVRPKIKLYLAGTAHIRPVIDRGVRVDQYASVPGNPPLIHYVAVPATGGPGVSGGRPSKQSAGCDEFTGLKPGRYILRGDMRYLQGPVTRYETVPIEIASGQTSEVALDFNGSCEIKLEVDFAPGVAVSVLLETADTPAEQKSENNLGLRASAHLREPEGILIPDLKPGVYRLSLFRRNVPEKKGVAEKKEPDEVQTITLDGGQASQSFSFRF